MSMQLSELVDQLKGKVPARNNIPGDEQYRQAVIDAVDDFSLRASREKIVLLAIVNGKSTYDLPEDFVKIIKLEGLAFSNGILNTPAGLVPMSSRHSLDTFRERLLVSNRVLTIVPTPVYSMQRELRYAAGWALDPGDEDYGDEFYADLGDTEARIILLKAQGDCLSLQANTQGGGILRYSIGDESFDKSAGVDALIKSVDNIEARYLAAVDRYVGSLMIQG